VEVIKAFLSRSTDRYRPPYGKHYVERARQGVLIGTTNTTDYLRDVSGNRRIWPVRCEHVELEWLAENREQLWAEAAARETAGESVWLDDVTIREQATQAQAERMTDDVWSEPVEDWLRGKVEVTTADALTSALGIPRERQSRKEEMRVAAILSKAGWERVVRWDTSASKSRRFWQRKAG
jgi:predicted P-loop ATPase